MTAGFLLAGAACRTAEPIVARERPFLGVVRAVPDPDHDVFLDELRSQGWDADRGLRVLPGSGDDVSDVDAAAANVRTWVRDGVDVILALSTPLAQAALEAAPATPVLFLVNDPVAAGLVRDREHPDGNATGVTFLTPADRTLAFADEVLGGVERIAYLWPEGDPGVTGHRMGIIAAAEELGLDLVDAPFRDASALPELVLEFAAEAVDAVVLASSNTTVAVAEELEDALDDAGLPAIANTEILDFAVVTLAPDAAEVRRQLGRQAARLLGGAPVSDVPVEDPRRFTLVVNRTKADALGLPSIPREVLRQVDVVR